MESYNNFIGIDIGKFNFVVANYNSKKTFEYPNTTEGFELFIQQHHAQLKESLSVLEVTGGYEMALLKELRKKKYSVHRADTRKVKNFIRSYG